MRTTVTLDPDTRELLRRRMAERGVSFKQALNDAIRESSDGTRETRPYRLPTAAMGVPLIDLTHANRLAADLEDEEIIRKLALGK